jgi:hypothetical protein
VCSTTCTTSITLPAVIPGYVVVSSCGYPYEYQTNPVVVVSPTALSSQTHIAWLDFAQTSLIPRRVANACSSGTAGHILQQGLILVCVVLEASQHKCAHGLLLQVHQSVAATSQAPTIAAEPTSKPTAATTSTNPGTSTQVSSALSLLGRLVVGVAFCPAWCTCRLVKIKKVAD